MSQYWKLTGLVLVLAGMSGCASMSSDECMSSDWAAIGYEDGARGYSTTRFGHHRKACTRHGVMPDFAAYQRGRDQGLVEYCQPGRGFDIGSSGGNYAGVCSPDLEGDFLDAYHAGHHLHTLQSNVNRATSQINSKERDLERIEEEMRGKEVALISTTATVEERVLLLKDLKELSEQTGQLEAEIVELQELRARSRVELENYQVALVDFGY